MYTLPCSSLIAGESYTKAKRHPLAKPRWHPLATAIFEEPATYLSTDPKTFRARAAKATDSPTARISTKVNNSSGIIYTVHARICRTGLHDYRAVDL